MGHLPTRLCLRKKNLHCFCTCLRTPTRTLKYQVVSLRGFIRSSLEYIMLVIQKETMLIWGNCMLVLVFYTSIQAFTLITTNVSKWERSGRLFLVLMLGLTTSMDGFWVIFTLARCGRTNSFAAYVLAFTGKSNIKCLNVPYKFLHWRFSSLLNSENCLHLTM